MVYAIYARAIEMSYVLVGGIFQESDSFINREA